MLKKVLVIANPGSGKNEAKKYAEKLQNCLEEAHQSQVTIRLTQQPGDATEWAKSATQDGFDSVICLGGDGTVNETVQGLLHNEPQPYFGFVPLGTVNDLARAIGYDMNPEKAIQQFRQVRPVPMDVATVNDTFFINVLAIGEIAESVMETDSSDKNTFGFLAYVKDAVGAVFSHKNYVYRITVDQDEQVELDSSLVVVALTNSVGGFEKMFTHASFSDGYLHIAAIKGTKPHDLLKAVFEGGVPQEETDQIFVSKGKEITVELIKPKDKTFNVNIDGDKGPALPLTIKVLSGAVKVLQPIK